MIHKATIYKIFFCLAEFFMENFVITNIDHSPLRSFNIAMYIKNIHYNTLKLFNFLHNENNQNNNKRQCSR